MCERIQDMADTPSRMLSVLSLLQTGRIISGEELAHRFGITARTVRRDIERLRELGYRIDAHKGPDGGYVLSAGTELPPLLLDGDQAVAVAVALRNAPAMGVDMEEAATRALATLRQMLPSRFRHRVDGLRFTGTPGRATIDPEVLETISNAVARRRIVVFDYRAGADEPTADPVRRSAEPHAVIAHQGLWCVVAWDLGRTDWRIYRLDRVSLRPPLGAPFTPREIPGGDASTFLAARFKGARPAGSGEISWPYIGHIEMALPLRQVLPWVEEGGAQALSEEASLLTLGSWSWSGLLAQVLRFDAPFRILGPPQLQDAADALALRLQQASGRQP
ncbi:WYL domain-containing protein [Nesterenkonia flava]